MSLRTIGVCHVASGDRWAGAEVQLSGLLRALQRIEDLSVCAIFLNEGRLAAEARQSGIEICVLQENEWNFFQILSRATRFLRGRHIQILHSHRYKENLLAALLARRCHVPVHICSRHGAPEPFTGLRRYKQGMIEQLEWSVARYSANLVVSVSEDLRKQLASGISDTKVVTVYNGIDEQKAFSALSTAEAKQRLGILPECYVVGSVGRLEAIKRLDIFLAVAQRIVRMQPNTKFIIAGEGKEEQQLRDLALGLSLQDQVLFLGHRNDIFDVLRALDVLVLCSDHEGLPMALLESLYLGVPVVARAVGGIPEVIQNGVSGILVDSCDPAALADQCVHLLRDARSRSQIAEAGTRLIAEKFTVAKNAAEMARQYRSLVQLSPGEPR